MNLKSTIFTMLFLFGSFFQIFAQNSILVVSSATGVKKVLQLSSTDGAVLNANFIDLTAQNVGTIKGVAQVNDKIWVTDQTNDKIYIYDLTGAYVSTIATGLDNVRGINVVNNEVWVANDGNANGSTADSIIRYSTTGTFIGIYTAPNTSIFDMIDNKSGVVYVTGLDTNGIQKLNYSGASVGSLVAPGVFQNLQQLNIMANGNILAAVFQNHSTSGNNAGVYVLSPTNGSILNFYPVATGNLRGVIQTDNGNILYTTGSALFSINPATSVQTQLVSGQFQFLKKALIPSLAVGEVKGLSFKIYPNPVDDVINIEAKGDLQKIEIYTSDGRLLKKQMINNEKKSQINVSDLGTGNYYMVLQIDGQLNKHQFIKK